MSRAIAEIPVRERGCCVALPEEPPLGEVQELAAALKAVADPTRLRMLRILGASAQPVCVCDFTATFDIGQPTVSHHLARLRDAGFVRSEKRGLWHHWSLREDMPAVARRVLPVVT
jgi:ArsR family transcriptional regulator